ncbi:glycosyltransferase [Deltaproteobacteria bacterium IMCC39524]|nr:glycosyltransferase [Deltaproteobacteria bacterium IMCC39524]
MNESITVSIVIPTYNDLDNLMRAIRSIELMQYPCSHYEVIVVDDGSVDGTGVFVKDLMARVKINLNYIYQENKGPAAARNTGIKKSQGKYLLVIDSDCFVDKNILNQYLRHFPNETLAGVGGNVLPDKENTVARYLDHLEVWRPGYRGERVTYLVTANAFFLREAIVGAGYFDEDFRVPGGEEPELCHRIIKNGYHFKYDENAKVTHSHRTTIKSMMKMFCNHGKGYAIFVSKWPEVGRGKTFCRTIFGIDAIRRFTSIYMRNLNIGEAVLYFILDYLRVVATYYGYRSIMKVR